MGRLPQLATGCYHQRITLPEKRSVTTIHIASVPPMQQSPDKFNRQASE
jgi:hypothetical protein